MIHARSCETGRPTGLGVAAMVLGLAAAATCQDWTDDRLIAESSGFQASSVIAQFEQVAKLLAEQRSAYGALVNRIHGDHREYRLKIDRLLEDLVDPSWQVREKAERTLIEVGGRAFAVIQQKRDEYELLEQHMRCARILDALAAKGTKQEDQERLLLRGLVRTALYLDPEPRLLRALRSALGHTDQWVANGAIRALGRHGGEDDVEAVAQMIGNRNGLHRPTAVAALSRMSSPAALAHVRRLLDDQSDTPAARSEAIAIVRALQARSDPAARALLRQLERHADPLVAATARITLRAADRGPVARITLSDRGQVSGAIRGLVCDAVQVAGAFPGLPVAELTEADCSSIEFPDHAVAIGDQARVFLEQGSLVSGAITGLDADALQLRSKWFGDQRLARRDIQGIAFDPRLDRLVGASTEHDRIRLRSGENIDGRLLRITGDKAVVLASAGERQIPVAELSGVLFARPTMRETDPASYTRIELVTSERLIGLLVAASPAELAIGVPGLGAATLPLQSVSRIDFGVGSGAMWGFTLICDYSDNKIIEIDDQGREVFVLENLFGPWDAECLENGNLLITEFAGSRVQELTRSGDVVWVFEDLKNPYDADRLPNGNTLIADTFGGRVIEVDRDGKIVWSYAKGIRPYDADRLPNGNTLIADAAESRVIEVDPGGEIVWEVKGMLNVHDADRLPNGNTLITLRNKNAVIEVDRAGRIVFEIRGLSAPSDADRLPNGNTLVAENSFVREFDRQGNEVWRKAVSWAVEVNRY